MHAKCDASRGGSSSRSNRDRAAVEAHALRKEVAKGRTSNSRLVWSMSGTGLQQYSRKRQFPSIVRRFIPRWSYRYLMLEQATIGKFLKCAPHYPSDSQQPSSDESCRSLAKRGFHTKRDGRLSDRCRSNFASTGRTENR